MIKYILRHYFHKKQYENEDEANNGTILNNSKRIRIKFMPEWCTWPIWKLEDTPNGIYEPIAPASLPISANLKHDIMKFDRIYQAMLDQRYPPDSGFSDAQANTTLDLAIHQECFSLYKRLEEELKDTHEVTASQDILSWTSDLQP
ncbi:hypothetical protein RVX_R02610 [Nitratidesulfovibrio sp. HK-II]|uniref:hypothetical protein n=1 Tax=Nitratidesulfovibrio sp. HK-II TaxID=2009266 RepID=UPI0011C0553E|nr:hypothetical protein [Nitratidesulfovibrio sp. HK-II]